MLRGLLVVCLHAPVYLPAAAAVGLAVGRANAGKPPAGVGVSEGTPVTDAPGALAGADVGPAGTMTTSMAGAFASTAELFDAVVGAEKGGVAAATGADILTAAKGAAGVFVISVTGAGEAVMSVILLAGTLGTGTAACVLALAAGTVALLALIVVAWMAGEIVALLMGGEITAVTLLIGVVAGVVALTGLLVT